MIFCSEANSPFPIPHSPFIIRLMLKHLHSLSAILFYVLGASFFVAYLLHFNKLLGLWPRWWFEVADMPLIIAAILYGGTSLFLSIYNPERSSTALKYSIAIPLIALFLFLVALNYWSLFN